MRRSVVWMIMMALLWVPPMMNARERSSRWHVVWYVSQALVAGANAADIASSWNRNEANPMVRAGPRFSYAALGIKLGALGGGLAVQHYLVRKSPAYEPYMASTNLAAAGALAIVAVHNYSVPH